MSDPPHAPPPARRRSSFAYDPARDTFKELRDTRVDEVIAEDVQEESANNNATTAVTSSPAAAAAVTTDASTIDKSRKRRRSGSPERAIQDGSGKKLCAH